MPDVSFFLHAEIAEKSSILAIGMEAEKGRFAGGMLAVASTTFCYFLW